jgi:oxysterol-binding protein-related protein 3/6/7
VVIQSYLIRWISVKPEHTISWSIQPHKKSINFGIFKHPGPQVSLIPHLPPLSASAPPSLNPESDFHSTVIDKLTSIGLKQVSWLGKCEADKITQGSYDVLANEGGNYALVFDNTFSKQISKTATLVLLTYPTKHPPQFGAQIHHSQVASPGLPPSQAHRNGLGLRSVPHEQQGQPLAPLAEQAVPATSLQPPPPSSVSSIDAAPAVHTGILHKRRRKRHQGHARRFFSLDFTSSTLSYYHDKNSSALRGAIPLSLAAIGANAKTRELSIDSGAEIWHLRASNQADFETWKRAFERAARIAANAISPRQGLSVDTQTMSRQPPSFEDEQDWIRAEALLSRVAGTRDAVRRLCSETEITLHLSTPSNLGSTASSPAEVNGDEYFKQEDKRPFWKRKPSGTSSSSPVNRFKRSASTQLNMPAPTGESSHSGERSRSSYATPAESPNQLRHHHQVEQTMNDHCRALLRDLDAAVAEFSALISESKQRRAPVPQSAASRLSVKSVDSQEFFDASEGAKAPFFEIPDDSDDEASHGKGDAADDDSDFSSDFDESGEFTGTGRGFRSDSLTSIFPQKAKSLAPLPISSVRRRSNVRAPTIMPPSLIGFLRKNVGKDLSTISMPVSANEPISLLQRASEQLDYSALLDKATKATDPVERLIFVTAFAISSLSSTRVKERAIRKPFNPMLGETFELVREDKGYRFLAEKVSHRPVQLALHAEAQDWSFAQSPLPSQKFWGKSAEIVTDGKARVVLHTHSECFSWSPATSFLRNVIAGEKYVEPVGSMTVVNEISGLKATVTFKAKGMFSGRSEDVSVDTFDTHGEPLSLGLQGSWTQSLRLTEDGALGDVTIWSAGSLVNNAAKHYGMTSFAATLNEITEIEDNKLSPTDSRLRPDQRALEQGDHEEAEELKARLEEAQRSRRKDMESAGEEWRPRWFTKTQLGEEVIWKLKAGRDGYWEERAKGTWTDVIPVLQL